MLGTYCIINIERNRDFKLGILKVSWLICKLQDDNQLITLSTSDYYISQDENNFKNHCFKEHGISNKKMKMEGESFFYVLDRLYDNLKDMDVDYVCGYKFKEHDLKYIYEFAERHDIINFKKDFFTRKYLIVDIFEIVGQWTKKKGISVQLDYEHLYPYLFKSQYPKIHTRQCWLKLFFCRISFSSLTDIFFANSDE